jgi:hypothetical protein
MSYTIEVSIGPQDLAYGVPMGPQGLYYYITKLLEKNVTTSLKMKQN